MKTFITVREKINALKNVIRQPYAWPGGYEKIIAMSDGELVCKRCVKENYREIIFATKTEEKFSQWAVDSVILDCELEPREWIEENLKEYSLDMCAHCYKILNP
ncbi:hypothetical protein EBR03_09095 [bacterium]|nr:hypothetical protein [bacterium]